MAKLKSEREVTCPCCQATLVIDEGLRRVVRHVEPERADRPKLDEAHRILAEEKARRDALFDLAVQSEKTRGDALSREVVLLLRYGEAGHLAADLARREFGEAAPAATDLQNMVVRAYPGVSRERPVFRRHPAGPTLWENLQVPITG